MKDSEKNPAVLRENMELKGSEVSDLNRQVQERMKKGDIHDYHREYEKAIVFYDDALRMDPDCADAWFNKAITLNKMEKHSEAMICVARAISLYTQKR
jgi:tetratricopeptide (TPR) repeat protein